MTTIPLERIGIIPTGSYFGPIPDADGDGVPDYSDLFKTYGGPYEGVNPSPVGDSELWLEYDDGAGGFLNYDKNTGNTNLPNTLYIPDNCQNTFELEDIQPIMDNLSAYYNDGDGVQQEMSIPNPDLSSVVITDRNVDQQVPITVERTTLGDETVSITVYFTVNFPCIEESAATTGYELEGNDDLETYENPTTLDDTTMDPDDLGYGFFEDE